MRGSVGRPECVAQLTLTLTLTQTLTQTLALAVALALAPALALALTLLVLPRADAAEREGPACELQAVERQAVDLG